MCFLFLVQKQKIKRIIKDFRIANNLSPISNSRTSVPRWSRGLLRAGDPSLVLLIGITPGDAKHCTIAVCLYLNAERAAGVF